MSHSHENSASQQESKENSNVLSQQLQDYTVLIKQRVQFYREENTKMDEIFKKLKLLTDELRISGLGGCVDNIDKLVSEYEAKYLNPDNAALNQAEKLRKHNNYLSKLKICIRYYTNLNDTLSKEIKYVRSELDKSKENVNSILKLSSEDVQQLEEKARKYENELIKFEKKYPWLKNPEFDLPNISKYVDTLKALKEEKDSLVKELSIYQDLKPDIKKAGEQLAELKEQVKSMKLFEQN
ncbi:uncharacterized protein LOC115886592 [Sitophilus oryzae]|uniref:Uncharacterized protein LOC115886592 n=1 Tax=Sitophilus oryzae TaxID=7048 RepID=A0A6J2YEX1_SITOR|nr:uncharacterized protein LOC115886592 [Sitophilus oryzae]